MGVIFVDSDHDEPTAAQKKGLANAFFKISFEFAKGFIDQNGRKEFAISNQQLQKWDQYPIRNLFVPDSDMDRINSQFSYSYDRKLSDELFGIIYIPVKIAFKTERYPEESHYICRKIPHSMYFFNECDEIACAPELWTGPLPFPKT